jgi:hypothetical protein
MSSAAVGVIAPEKEIFTVRLEVVTVETVPITPEARSECR